MTIHLHSDDASRSDRHVGLLAAWGGLPIEVARALRAQDYRISCLAVVGHANPALEELCDDFQWIGLAKLGGAIRFFRRCGVTQATMAGKFHKVLIYQPGAWWRHLPDWTFLKTFYRYFITHDRDRKDDTLLGVLADAFAAEGITFHPATDYAPELLVKPGQIAGRPLTAAQQKGHRVRLGDCQADGRTRYRPEHLREGSGRDCGRGDRGYRRLYPPRRSSFARRAGWWW